MPPPVSAPQPSMCEAALTPPSIAQAVPTTAAAAPAATSPPVAAPAAPATARAPSPRAVRAPPVSTAAPLPRPPPPPPVASASAICCEANRSMSCAAWRSTSATRCPALCSRGSTSEGRPMIWGAGRWRRQSWRAPGDSERAVQPVAAAPQHVHRLVLRHAPHRCRRARRASRHDRLRGLNATFAETAPQSRGPGRVQPVVAQGLAGIRAPIVAVGQEGRPGELSGRAREGDGGLG